MANLEVIALDTVTPQLKAPQAGDGYAMPRPVAVTGTFDVTGAATATSLALGGATLGANAFAVTGSSALTGVLGVTGAATATSLALGGATLGANAFAVTGNSALTGTFGVTGAATATSLALGGATLGTNAIAVTGSSLLTGAATITEPVGSTALTLTGATQTTAVPALNATQTWNNSAVTFAAVKVNVTDTTSATASLLADFQVGASSKFAVRKDGSIIIAQGAILRANNGAADGEIFISSVNNGNQISISDLGVTTRDGISFSVTGANRITRDVFVYRKAAASLQFGAFDAAAPVAQTIGPQSVVAGTSNTAGQNFTVRGSQGTGTGAGGSILFQTAPAGGAGTAQNALVTQVTVAGSGGTTLTEVVGSSALTLTGATQTTSQPVLNATQTWNNVATTFTGIKLNVTDTTSAAASLLMDLQTGGGSPVSKFKVDKSGNVTFGTQGLITAPNITGTTELYIFASNYIHFNRTASAYGIAVAHPSSSLNLYGGYYLAFATGNSAPDCFLGRKGAANLMLGAADVAAPTAQILSASSVVAGTSNTAGQNLTVRGSQGTGTGVGGDIIFQVAPAGSSGSAQNTLVQAMRVYNTKTVAVGSAFTVATLPAAGTQGRRAWVTDALAPTFLMTLTGGGAVVCPVFDDGTNWIAG